MYLQSLYEICNILREFNVFNEPGPGLETGDLESWISSYLDPLETVLLWAIPVVLAIYLLIKAITWVQKESEGEQQPPYWVQVKRGIIVGIIAESVDLLLKVFSISG